MKWSNLDRYLIHYIENYRTKGFQSNIYPNSIEGDENDEITDYQRQRFSEYLSKIKNNSKTLG